jgi:hypothetical protein
MVHLMYDVAKQAMSHEGEDKKKAQDQKKKAEEEKKKAEEAELAQLAEDMGSDSAGDLVLYQGG